MGIINSIKNFVNKSFKKEDSIFIPLNETNAELFRLLGTDYKFGTKSKDFLLSAYGGNPYVFNVIDRITQRVVDLEKNIVNKNGEEVEDLDFIEILKNPNPKESGEELAYRFVANYLSAGEVFLIRLQELGERDSYYVPVNYNVTINEDSKGNVISYWVNMFGHSETYLPNEVLHVVKPDITIDTNHGFSTLRANRKVWETNNEVWKSEGAIHKNKGISGVLYSDGQRPMTSAEQDELQKEYDSKYTGTNNFGKVKVSTAKLGFVPMGMNPNDLKSVETRIEHLRTICASFNVDSRLFGDVKSSTYNNMSEAKKAFVLDAVLPIAKLLMPKMVGFMSKSVFREYSVNIPIEEIPELYISFEEKSARIGRELVQGIITPKQAREMIYPDLVDEEIDLLLPSANEGEDVLETSQEAEDTNAQAQANLRGSLGGVQGIIQIQQGVIDGVTPRSSAVTILMEIYGFDERTANQILG